ncbi:CvpA family protein [Roseimaritima ulvae]|uniref:Colicin V production protein n=1 Tax=Roseimaritima ulvae TaxID=980254 RepID=A0A5B9QSR1_9BACT|nr:CvpA family protein [Roseimaritima ulvae]QEG42157.1 Colicin V production protein [Roseimaritima ulvae]
MFRKHEYYGENPAAEFPISIVATGLFAPPILYFAYQQDYVLAAALAAVAVSAVSGFKLGLLRIFGSLVGISAAIALAPGWGRSQAHHFSEWFGTTGLTNRFLAIGTIGLLIALAITCVFVLLSRRIFEQRPRLDATNRWTGLLAGAGQGAVAMLLLLGGILTIEPLQREQREQQTQLLQQTQRGRAAAGDSQAEELPASMIHNLVTQTAERTQSSVVGPLVTQYNPFERIPQLNQISKLQRTAQVLHDPAEVEGLLRHPEVVRLQQQPSMQAAIASVRQDSEIQEILQSGEPINGHKAMRLLSNPAVMELVDQPEFVKTVSQILEPPAAQLK